RKAAIASAAAERAKRAEQLAAAIRGKDRAAAIAAFEAAEADEAVRDAAIAAALASEHVVLRSRALRQHFLSARSFSGSLKGAPNKQGRSTAPFESTFSIMVEEAQERQGVVNL